MNEALIAHSVPILGCERNIILTVLAVTVTPVAATGVLHWQVDLFCVIAFFPMWGIARALYLYDPRSASKILEHLTWRSTHYAPHGRPSLNNRGGGNALIARIAAFARTRIGSFARS